MPKKYRRGQKIFNSLTEATKRTGICWEYLRFIRDEGCEGFENGRVAEEPVEAWVKAEVMGEAVSLLNFTPEESWLSICAVLEGKERTKYRTAIKRIEKAHNDWFLLMGEETPAPYDYPTLTKLEARQRLNAKGYQSPFSSVSWPGNKKQSED